MITILVLTAIWRGYNKLKGRNLKKSVEGKQTSIVLLILFTYHIINMLNGGKEIEK